MAWSGGKLGTNSCRRICYEEKVVRACISGYLRLCAFSLRGEQLFMIENWEAAIIQPA